MRKTSMKLSAVLSLTAFVALGWSTTFPGKDPTAVRNVLPAKVLASKAEKPLPAASADSKDTTMDPNVTEAPDPATPLLVGSGLIALSLLRRKLRRNLPD